MRLDLPQLIDRNQWLMRMGITGKAADEWLASDCLQNAAADNAAHAMADLAQQMQQAQEKLFAAALPQGIYRIIRLEDFYFTGDYCDSGWLELPGSSIRKHLEGCESIVLMAVTLGAGVDRLIRTSQVRNMAEAVVLDSGASVLAEQMADELEKQICAGSEDPDETAGDMKSPYARESYRTHRYSPGYGDFPIEMQRKLVEALDTYRTIGLSVNESHILIPGKSVTAVIGLADHPVSGHLAACDECLLKEKCSLRKEGKNCAGFKK